MLVLKGLVSYAYHMLFLISVTPKDYPYMWHTGKWDDCSIPCGSGNQTRDVYCAKSDGNRTSSEYCSETKLPAKYRRCYGKQCGNFCILLLICNIFIKRNELRKTNEVNDSLSGWMRVCVRRRVRG